MIISMGIKERKKESLQLILFKSGKLGKDRYQRKEKINLYNHKLYILFKSGKKEYQIKKKKNPSIRS